MASGFELNEEANRRRVLDGMKGGPLFQLSDAVTLPPIKFADGIPAEVKAAQMAGMTTPTMRVEAPWFNRRGN